MTKYQVLFRVAVEGDVLDFAVAHAKILFENIPDQLFLEHHRRLFNERRSIQRSLRNCLFCELFDLGDVVDDGMFLVEFVGYIKDGFSVIKQRSLFIEKFLKLRWPL